MAPSFQQIQEDIPFVSSEKLDTLVKVTPQAKESPKVKRQIEVEGGTTDAKASLSF